MKAIKIKRGLNKPIVIRLSLIAVIKLLISVIIIFTTLKAGSQTINSPDTVYYGENINFSINSSNVSSAKWYFGDGDSSLINSPSHSYTPSSCGYSNYSIQLFLTDTSGVTNSYSKVITVKNLPPLPQVSDIDLITPFSNCDNSPSLSNPDFSITFNNNTTDTAEVAYYQVDWGDNSGIFTYTNDSFPITHTYHQLGLFTFTITSYNSQGCSATKTYDIANQSNPAVGLSSLGSTQGCAPQEFTFILSQYQNNSPGTYYVWDFGDGSPTITWSYNDPYINDSIKHTFSITSCGTSSHSFTVSVTAHNYCDQTTATVGNIRIYTKPTASFSSSADTSCTGTSINFSNFTQSGFGYNCNGNANYFWDFGDGTTSTASNATHSYSQEGTYKIKLMATNGVCGSSTDSTFIVINETPQAIGAISQTTACDSLTVTTTNQSTGGNLHYLWTVSPQTGWHFLQGYSASDQEPVIKFDSIGIYTLTLTATNNCGYDDTSFSVTIQGKPQANIAPIPDFCGTANITPISTVNTNFSPVSAYSWSFVGAGQSSSTLANPANIIYSDTGNYIVSLKVTNQCGADSTYTTFTVHSIPKVQINSPVTQLCYGDTTIVTASGANQYLWQTNSAIVSTQNQNAVVNPAATTSFIVTGTDTNNCQNNDTLIIKVNPLPVVNISTTNTTLCEGDTILAMATGATTYQWNYGSAATASGQTLSFVPQTSGMITLTGTDTNNCSATDTVSYQVYQHPVLTISNITPVCKGDTLQIAVGGAGNFSIQPQASAVILSNGSFRLFPAASTTYTLTAWDLAGCTTDTNIAIIVNPLPTVTATTNKSSVCLGQSVQLTAQGAQNYQWTPASGLSSVTGSQITATPNATSTYIVTGTDQNGCQNSDSVNINVYSLLNVNITATAGSVCFGDSVTLTATGASSFSWQQTPGISTTNGAVVTAVPPSTTTYVVTGTDTTGCIATNSITITVHQLPTVSITATKTAVCQGDSLSLTASGAGSYVWTYGNQTSTGSTITDYPATATTYQVTGTDSNSCSSTNAVTIGILPNPVISATVNKSTICIGESVNLTATGGTTYSWSPQNLVSQPNAAATTSTPAQSKWFTVTGTNSQGCSAADSVFVKVNPLPQISTQQQNPAICFGDSINLSVSGNGQISWLPVTGLGAVSGNTVTASPLQTTTYTATVTDTNGCSNSTTINLTVHSLPQAAFSLDTLSCINSNVNIVNQSTNTATYLWDFGDNTTSTLQNPAHGYSQTGYYQTRLIAVSTNSCSDTATAFVHVIAAPTAQFTAYPQSGCSPLNLYLNNNSTSYGGSYFWNFGNGTTSTGENPTGVVLPATQGHDTSYVVFLTTSNICGTSSYSDTISVLTKPVANFGFTLNTQCSPATATFGNISSGNSSSFYWDLGDTTFTTQQTPASHIYTAGNTPVTYPVTLIASNGCGADTAVKYLTVNPNYVNALFTPSQTQACAPATIGFNNFSNIQNMAIWDFGDGNVSSQINPTHQYANAGTYNVSLIVTDNCGVDTAFATITVGAPPQVSFTTSADTVCQYQSLSLSNTTANLTNLQWFLGDSTTSTLSSFNHSYQNYGNFTVTLIGEDAGSHCTDTTTKTIVVNPSARAVISANRLDGCTPLTVNFQSQSTGASYLSWDFGNGNTAINQSISSSYNTAGNYHVQLIADNYYGCADTTYVIVKAYPVPVANFTMNNTTPCNFPAAFEFINHSKGATGYKWDFDNGDSANSKNPLTYYQNAGTYHPSLIAYNSYLCSDTAYKTIILNKLPEADFSIDSKTGCEGKEIQFTNKSKNATSYLWDFDNGSTSNTEHPLATFSTQGIYFPYLVAYNKTGCSDTAYYSDTIKIRPNPVTDFTWKAIDKGPEERGNYRFINLCQGANIFEWDFDDGDTSMAVNPVHRFSDRGDYAITLKTTNEYGCSTQLSKYLTVNILKGLYIPTALAPGNPNPEVRLFTPKGKGLLSYHLAIYDSWGNIIWETTALDNGEPVESWDGTYKGKPVPQGVYYWHAEAVFEDNTIWQGMVLPDGQQITKGSVTVLR